MYVYMYMYMYMYMYTYMYIHLYTCTYNADCLQAPEHLLGSPQVLDTSRTNSLLHFRPPFCQGAREEGHRQPPTRPGWGNGPSLRGAMERSEN